MTDKFVRVPRISIGDDDEKTILENTEEHLGDEEIMYETLKVEETIYEESIYETPREYLDDDETKVEDVEEYLDDSTYPESEVPDSEYHKRGKTSIESEPSYKEDIPEKAKSTLEMEYLLKNTNLSLCESIFP
ncbi:hypothetical protein Avbf_12995 [Armadillidium vulgare]|nr:hypothetical protein Avbf_12995 [Armadillidium vulgare]